jgi:hypothetical protein
VTGDEHLDAFHQVGGRVVGNGEAGAQASQTSAVAGGPPSRGRAGACCRWGALLASLSSVLPGALAFPATLRPGPQGRDDPT